MDTSGAVYLLAVAAAILWCDISFIRTRRCLTFFDLVFLMIASEAVAIAALYAGPVLFGCTGRTSGGRSNASSALPWSWFIVLLEPPVIALGATIALWILGLPSKVPPRCATGECSAADFTHLSSSPQGEYWRCACGVYHVRRGRRFFVLGRHGLERPFMRFLPLRRKWVGDTGRGPRATRSL